MGFHSILVRLRAALSRDLKDSCWCCSKAGFDEENGRTGAGLYKARGCRGRMGVRASWRAQMADIVTSHAHRDRSRGVEARKKQHGEERPMTYRQLRCVLALFRTLGATYTHRSVNLTLYHHYRH